jgi:hypothetical protein
VIWDPPEGFDSWREVAGCAAALLVGAVVAYLAWGVTP